MQVFFQINYFVISTKKLSFSVKESDRTIRNLELDQEPWYPLQEYFGFLFIIYVNNQNHSPEKSYTLFVNCQTTLTFVPKLWFLWQIIDYKLTPKQPHGTVFGGEFSFFLAPILFLKTPRTFKDLPNIFSNHLKNTSDIILFSLDLQSS